MELCSPSMSLFAVVPFNSGSDPGKLIYNTDEMFNKYNSCTAYCTILKLKKTHLKNGNYIKMP